MPALPGEAGEGRGGRGRGDLQEPPGALRCQDGTDDLAARDATASRRSGKVQDGEIWIGGRSRRGRPARRPRERGPPRKTGARSSSWSRGGGKRRRGDSAQRGVRGAHRDGDLRPRESLRPSDTVQGLHHWEVGRRSPAAAGTGFSPAQKIELLIGRTAVSLDPSRRVARMDGGLEVAFDKALLATGGFPRRLAIPGADAPGASSFARRKTRGQSSRRPRGQKASPSSAPGSWERSFRAACGTGACPSP